MEVELFMWTLDQHMSHIQNELWQIHNKPEPVDSYLDKESR